MVFATTLQQKESDERRGGERAYRLQVELLLQYITSSKDLPLYHFIKGSACILPPRFKHFFLRRLGPASTCSRPPIEQKSNTTAQDPSFHLIVAQTIPAVYNKESKTL